VVLLHGQPGSAADWTAVSDRLLSSFTVVTPDRPGYGRTGGRAAGFAANADATCELLDRLGTASAIVVGHSWGGGVALALAEMQPERVHALALVASVGPCEAVGVVDRLLAIPPIGSMLASVALGSAGRALAHPAVRHMVERRVAAPTGDALGRSWRQGGTAHSFAIEQRALIDELGGLTGGLSALRAPTVVVVGTADRIVAPAVGERLARRIPGATLVRVEGAGHLLPFSHPDVIAAAVVSVARRVGSPLSVRQRTTFTRRDGGGTCR